MPTIDNDSMIRDRAYLMWERAGRPSGQEHEHWAEARRQIEAETMIVLAPEVTEPPHLAAQHDDGKPLEVVRLRQALYTPEPFSFELFGDECPEIDSLIVIRQAA